jgi:hypothetical protein
MQSDITDRHRRWAQIWPSTLIFLFYSLLTIIVTWPAITQLNSAIPGSEGDALNHLWTFRWIKQALLSGQNPFFTDLLYYPQGVSLLTHNIAWVHIAAWLPLQAMLGEAAAYTLVFLLIFPLNGLALYLLARQLTGSMPAAAVGGLVVAFWPYILAHHNHPNLILIAWIPLTLLTLRRLLHDGRWRDVALTALFLALTGLTRWQLLIIAAPLLGLYLLHELASTQVQLTRHLAGLLFTAGAGALLLMAPLLLPVVANQVTREDPDALFVAENPQQTDLLAYGLPNRYHPLWGETVYAWYQNVGVNQTYTPFLGFTVLLLILFALWREWRAARFWLFTIVIYILLALGSTLRFNGQVLMPLPMAWLEDLFFVQIVRHPDRFNVLLSIPVAILAAYGIKSIVELLITQAWIAATVTRSRASTIAAICTAAFISLLILGEYIVSYPLYPLHTPAWYEQVAQEQGRFGILDLPQGSRSYDKEYMLHQFTHGQPLVGGHVSRLPQNASTFINSVPLLYSIKENPTIPPDLSNISQQMRLLHDEDVRYLVLHKKFLTAEEEAEWQKWLVLPPIYVDDDLLVYKTAVSPTELAISQPVTGINSADAKIGLIQVNVSPETALPGAWVTIDLDWGSETAVNSDYTTCLYLANESETVTERCEPLAPDWPTSRWQAGEIVHRRHTLQIDPFWPAGFYTLSISLHSPDEEIPAMPVASLALDSRRRQFAAPQPAQETAVTWDDLIRLVGYDTAVGEALDLTLYWQAQDRIEQSYKVFVHLIDSSDNSLVSQTDFIPQEWTYPTNWWEAGEFIPDAVQLSLEGIPPGDYEIRIGLYDSATGERLSPYSADAINYTGDIVPLHTVTIP